MIADQTIIEALKANGGFISNTAEALDISRSTVYKRIRKSKQVKEAYENIKLEYLDLAESQIVELIKAGNLAAIIFYLKCKGKDRGYVERQEVTGKDGAGLEKKVIVEFVEAPKGRTLPGE